jgi:hypothetical protein
MHPGSRLAPEPSRAECDAWDASHANGQAALVGAACLDLAQELVEVTDRYPSQWRADDMDKINELHGALVDALRIAQGIKS